MSDYEGHEGYLIPTDLVANDMIMERSGEELIMATWQKALVSSG